MKTPRHTPADVARYYDEWTPRYLEVSGDILQGYRAPDDEQLLRYTMQSAGFQAGDKILDAGCGVGGPAVFFAKHLPITIDAITVSEVQRELAEKKVRGAGLADRIHVRQGDYHLLDRIYPAAAFDRVVFLESLGHAADPAQVMRAVAAVTKPAGFVYVKDFFIKESIDPVLTEKIAKVIANMNRHYTYNALDLTQTLRALRMVDFSIVYVKRPEYVLDRSVPLEFEQRFGIDYFEGVGEPVDAVEWLEILCQKGPR